MEQHTPQDAMPLAEWSSILELAKCCDDIVRHIAAGMVAVVQQDKTQYDDELAQALTEVRETLTETLAQVPKGMTYVSDDDHPLYLKSFVEISDVKDRLFDEIVPMANAFTARAVPDAGLNIDVQGIINDEH
jgi:hypothetical protein